MRKKASIPTLEVNQDKTLSVGNGSFKFVPFGGEILPNGICGTPKVYMQSGDSRCKVVYKSLDPSSSEFAKNDLQNEFELLPRLEHVNIIRLIAASKPEDQLGFILEHAGVDLVGWMDHEVYPVTAQQLEEGIRNAQTFLYNLHIIHRDIKPENIIVSGENKIKVIDFGAAAGRGDRWTTYRSNVRAGTMIFLPPCYYKGFMELRHKWMKDTEACFEEFQNPKVVRDTLFKQVASANLARREISFHSIKRYLIEKIGKDKTEKEWPTIQVAMQNLIDRYTQTLFAHSSTLDEWAIACTVTEWAASGSGLSTIFPVEPDPQGDTETLSKEYIKIGNQAYLRFSREFKERTKACL